MEFGGFALNYRQSSTITVKDKFLIPVIEDFLNELHGLSIFSKMDFRVGYHRIKVKEVDIYKTTFRTHLTTSNSK